MDGQYDTLASVYAWLVPDALLEPDGAAAAFAPAIASLPPGSRVLDCAAGTGQLAVGLARRGHRVVASDASPAMIDSTRRLAARHDVRVEAVVCAWEDLARVIEGPFDAVLCVGNSLTHAVGARGRRAALTQMCVVLGDEGTLAITSRNWERLRTAAPRLEVGDRLVHRDGRAGLVIRAWTLADDWDAPHHVDVAVALVGSNGEIETVHERLTFHPFTYDQLVRDLRATGLEPVGTTYAPSEDRYLVAARRGAAP